MAHSDQENTPIIGRTNDTALNNKLLDSRGPYIRWIAVFLMSFLIFGSSYCDDISSGLQDVMKNDLKISSATFTSFYSWYSWPNVVLAAVSGVLLDKWFGIARGAVIFCGFVAVGQVVFGLGGFFRLIWLMNMGRFIFGIGSEALWSVQGAYAASWFFGKELKFVFGLQISFARVVSLISLNTIRQIYDSLSDDITGPKRIGVTLSIAVSTCIFSFGCAFILWWLDNRHRRVLLEDNANDTADEFRFRDIRHFPASFYCVCIICAFYSAAIFPFIAIAQLLFESKYGLSPAWSNACNSLIYFVSAVFLPILGFVIDRTGRDISWLIVGIIATSVAHILIAFLFVHPVVPLIMIGIGYSIVVTSSWPMVVFLVPKQMLGTAYGVMHSVQNLSLAIINIFTGLILDRYGYFILEIFFIVCLELVLLAATFLYLYNWFKRGMLNDSPSVRHAKYELAKTSTHVEMQSDNHSSEVIIS